MRIAMFVDSAAAIRAGKNAHGWQALEIDPATLTQEQRDILASCKIKYPLTSDAVKCCGAETVAECRPEKIQLSEASPESLVLFLADKGEILAAERAEIEQRAAQLETAIVAYLALPDTQKINDFEIVNNAYRGPYYVSEWETAMSTDPRLIAEQRRLQAVIDSKKSVLRDAAKPLCDQWEIDIAAYSAGTGPRPDWDWDRVKYDLRANDLVEATCTIDRQRATLEKQATDERKMTQLTAVVSRLGTPTQQERWTKKLMARSEAIALLWGETFAPLTAAGFNPMPADEYHLPVHEPEEYKEKCGRDESEKSTVTDGQYLAAGKAAGLIPRAEVAYYHDYYKGENDLPQMDIARISVQMGEYLMEADIDITEEAAQE